EEAEKHNRRLGRRARGDAQAFGDAIEKALRTGNLAGREHADGGDGGERRGEGRGKVRFWFRGREAGGDEGFMRNVDYLGRLKHFAVELRVDGADALGERRVRGPQSAERRLEALREKEVADFGGLVGLQ